MGWVQVAVRHVRHAAPQIGGRAFPARWQPSEHGACFVCCLCEAGGPPPSHHSPTNPTFSPIIGAERRGEAASELSPEDKMSSGRLRQAARVVNEGSRRM